MEYQLSWPERRIVNPIKRLLAKCDFKMWAWAGLMFTRDHIFMLMAFFYLLVMGDKSGFAVMLVLAFYAKLADINNELRSQFGADANMGNLTINLARHDAGDLVARSQATKEI